MSVDAFAEAIVEALYHISQAHMERGYELEKEALEAKSSFEQNHRKMLEQSGGDGAHDRSAVEQTATQSTTGEAVQVAAVGRSKDILKRKKRCFVCGAETENPLSLLRSPDCPYFACSYGCREDLHCRWMDIVHGWKEVELVQYQ